MASRRYPPRMALADVRRFWRVYRDTYAEEREASKHARAATRPAGPRLEKWKQLALVSWLLAWGVRGLDWLLGLSDRAVLALQLPLAILFVVAVLVIAASWLRRWATANGCR